MLNIVLRRADHIDSSKTSLVVLPNVENCRAHGAAPRGEERERRRDAVLFVRVLSAEERRRREEFAGTTQDHAENGYVEIFTVQILLC